MKNLKRQILSSFLMGCLLVAGAWADSSSGGDFTMTKDLSGATGDTIVGNGRYNLTFACGEPGAGAVMSFSNYTLISGYYAGRFGNDLPFTLLSSQIGQPTDTQYFQGPLRVGVPFVSSVTFTLADQFDAATATKSVAVTEVRNHLGQPRSLPVPVTLVSDPIRHTITLQPRSGAWAGNTLYDVTLTQDLTSVDGYALDQIYHLQFATLLDPHQDNLVSVADSLSIYLPAESLSGSSAILATQDPVHAPMRVDPSIIQEANAKAQATGGSYQVPISIQEIDAYASGGTLLSFLSRPASLTVNYGSTLSSSARPGLIRPDTLALYVLDEVHKLWVRIPASQSLAVSQSVTAPVAHFSVYAVMGTEDDTAGFTTVFPVPWRPHGPNAGNGPGQTGTEAGGMTFTNIPSQCTIKIYTLTGDLVRQIRHSDIGGQIGQDVWDGKTTRGDPAASGVYLWRVESASDGKNGKLMIIR